MKEKNNSVKHKSSEPIRLNYSQKDKHSVFVEVSKGNQVSNMRATVFSPEFVTAIRKVQLKLDSKKG